MEVGSPMSAEGNEMHVVRRAAARAQEIPPLRRAVAALARSAGFSPERVDDVALAVSEVLSNVVVHAYRDRPVPGQVDLVAAVDGASVHVTIADAGAGFAPRADSPGLGLGLALADMIADELRISSAPPSGTLVALRFDRDGGVDYDCGAAAA
jgi:anti-sigma regulatory factor (Ser/Thr protein kinase)